MKNNKNHSRQTKRLSRKSYNGVLDTVPHGDKTADISNNTIQKEGGKERCSGEFLEEFKGLSCPSKIISLKEWNLKMNDFDKKLITCNCAIEARDSTLAIIEEIDKILEYHVNCLQYCTMKNDLKELKQKLTGETNG